MLTEIGGNDEILIIKVKSKHRERFCEAVETMRNMRLFLDSNMNLKNTGTENRISVTASKATPFPKNQNQKTMSTKTTAEKAQKTKKPLSEIKKLKNFMRELTPIDAVLIIERLQSGTAPLKEAMKTEKNPVLLGMYKSITEKVEKHLS